MKILRVDTVDRKIGLSKKRADWAGDEGAVTPDDALPRKERKLRGGLGDGGEGSGLLGDIHPDRP